MIPQDQTILHTDDSSEPGNCWAACIASIVEIPIEEVPNFIIGTHWFHDTQRWLNDRGWGLLQVSWPDKAYGGVFGGQFPPSLAVIVSGWGPRGVRHSVVGQIDIDEEGFASLRTLHDPHPSREGLDFEKEELYVSFLFRLESI